MDEVLELDDSAPEFEHSTSVGELEKKSWVDKLKSAMNQWSFTERCIIVGGSLVLLLLIGLSAKIIFGGKPSNPPRENIMSEVDDEFAVALGVEAFKVEPISQEEAPESTPSLEDSLRESLASEGVDETKIMNIITQDVLDERMKQVNKMFESLVAELQTIIQHHETLLTKLEAKSERLATSDEVAQLTNKYNVLSKKINVLSKNTPSKLAKAVAPVKSERWKVIGLTSEKAILKNQENEIVTASVGEKVPGFEAISKITPNKVFAGHVYFTT